MDAAAALRAILTARIARYAGFALRPAEFEMHSLPLQTRAETSHYRHSSKPGKSTCHHEIYETHERRTKCCLLSISLFSCASVLLPVKVCARCANFSARERLVVAQVSKPGFQTRCVADFQIGGACDVVRFAGLETWFRNPRHSRFGSLRYVCYGPRG